MKPENKFQNTTLTIATFAVFGIWIGLDNLTNIPEWLQLITTVLMSYGVYKLVVVTLSGMIRKYKPIKKYFLGPYFLEGTWVGFYIGSSGKVRFMIERFEQEIDSLVIRGKCFNEKFLYHRTWTSEAININAKTGKLTYMYDVDAIKDISNNVGIASFKFERNNQYKPPNKLLGFSADLHISKKVKAIEVRVEEELADKDLLEHAKNVYLKFKDCF